MRKKMSIILAFLIAVSLFGSVTVTAGAEESFNPTLNGKPVDLSKYTEVHSMDELNELYPLDNRNIIIAEDITITRSMFKLYNMNLCIPAGVTVTVDGGGSIMLCDGTNIFGGGTIMRGETKGGYFIYAANCTNNSTLEQITLDNTGAAGYTNRSLGMNDHIIWSDYSQLTFNGCTLANSEFNATGRGMAIRLNNASRLYFNDSVIKNHWGSTSNTGYGGAVIGCFTVDGRSADFPEVVVEFNNCDIYSIVGRYAALVQKSGWSGSVEPINVKMSGCRIYADGDKKPVNVMLYDGGLFAGLSGLQINDCTFEDITRVNNISSLAVLPTMAMKNDSGNTFDNVGNLGKELSVGENTKIINGTSFFGPLYVNSELKENSLIEIVNATINNGSKIAVGTNGYELTKTDLSRFKCMNGEKLILLDNAIYAADKTVTFHSNIPGSDDETRVQYIASGQVCALEKNSFENEGKNFLGWASESDGSVIYVNEAEVMLTDNTDLYAVWDDTLTAWDPELSIQKVQYDGTEKSYETEEGYHISYNVDKPTEAGEYDVTITKAADEGHSAYSNTIHGGLVILPKEIRVYADAESIHIGETPELTYGINGAESWSDVLKEEPVVTTDYTGSNPAGTYSLIVKAEPVNSNYSIVKENAVLTVENHIPSGRGAVTESTCTTDGYTTYTCSVCGESYEDNIVKSPGHDFVYKMETVSVNPENGNVEYIEKGLCKVCGEESSESACSHKYMHHYNSSSGEVYYDGLCSLVYLNINNSYQLLKYVDSNTLKDSSGKKYTMIYGENKFDFIDLKPVPKNSSNTGQSKPAVSVSNPAGGSAAVSSDGTVTITPNDGYEIDKVTVNGTEIKVQENGIIEGLKSGDKVVVTFKVKEDPSETIENPFVDVANEDYYYDSVMWAVDKNVTTGIDESHFGPNIPCTRAQIVAFLWRLAGCPEPETADNVFTDIVPEAYYYNAVLWALEKGITEGTSETTFEPDKTCTRAQAVTFLWRNAGKLEGSLTNPFEDVADEKWYSDAVMWAVKEKITNGTGETIFSPEDFCTRAQIVTFLKRGVAE